jgi:outer membrane receptor protein involved in Fe transport
LPVLAQERAATAASAAGSLEEIIVTAQKVPETLVQTPVSLTVFSEQAINDYNIQEFTDYALKVPNLYFSVGGAAGVGLEESRVVQIRGMSGANTTSLYIDDTPLPDTLNPAVADIARIEVLRGPQGTLFGESSLGGNVRLISNRPSLTEGEFKYMVQSGWTDRGTELDYGGQVIGNLAVIPNVLGVRAMLVADHDSGFITRTYPCASDPAAQCETQGIGSHDTYGGSVSALWQPADRFTVDAKFLGQFSRYPNGNPIVYAYPTSYALTYTDHRVANQPETSDFHWYLPALTLRYQGDGWNALSATSYFRSYQTLNENNVEGLQYLSETAFGFTPGPDIPLVPAKSLTEQFIEELRLTVEPIHNLSGILGGFFKNLPSDYETSAVVPGLGAATGLSDLLYDLDVKFLTRDKSVFGELYYKIQKLTLTVGARAYWLNESTHIIPKGGFIFVPLAVDVEEHGITPKYGLKYEFSPQSMMYASAAKGFRPGGGNFEPPPVCDPELASLGLTRADTAQFKSDNVWSYEIGGKSVLSDGRFLLTGALFDIEWNDIQQVINLASCGSTFVANTGKARNRGGELELYANPTRALSLRAGVGYVDAVIVEPGAGSPLYVGEPVFNVPKWTANVGAVYTVREWQDKAWLITTDASYVGENYSGNTSGTMPVKRPSFYVWNASTSLQWAKHQNELSLYVKNLTNSIAFYGDTQPSSFGTNETINGVTYPVLRVAVSPPFQIGLQFRHGF